MTGKLTDPQTGHALPEREQPGYYPGQSVLAQQGTWDPATRAVVLRRVHEVPPLRFFTAAEQPLVQALFARLLPQDDRTPDKRIAVVNYIDDRLYRGIANGYRFSDMPNDAEAYRRGLVAIDQMAREVDGRPFIQLSINDQETLLQSLNAGQPAGAAKAWRHLPVKRFWSLLLQDAAEAYYSHPYAWDEIGFGGPAYPRGYMRLENGQPEPWEVNEKRYAWAAPAECLSDSYTNNEQYFPAGRSGHGGSH